MIREKITVGHVVQRFDENGELVSQEFVAGDIGEGAVECYHSFEMVDCRTHLRICRGNGLMPGHYWNTLTGENVPEPKGVGFTHELPCPNFMKNGIC